jgi:cation-transporting P-type ATPase F
MPRGSAAPRRTLRTRFGPGRRTVPIARPPFLALCLIGAACGLVVAFGRPIETAAILVVAAVKLGASRRHAVRATRMFAALGLAATVHTPLTGAISRLCRTLTLIVLALAAMVFAVGAYTGQTTLETGALVLIVGGVPVEPRATAAAALAACATRMRRRKAMVRRLSAVERIGATTVVCSTRTGSLTQNELTVTRIIAAGQDYETTGVGYCAAGDVRAAGVGVSVGDNIALDECLLAGFACNDSQIVDAAGTWQVIGDPLEAALLVSAAKHGLTKSLPRVATLPFAPDRRFMATLHRLDGAEPGVVFVKGAVERVLYLCDTQLDAEGRRQELDGAAIRAGADILTRRGLRVVAFAQAQVPAEVETLTERTIARLTFLGLQAVHDPVRPYVLDAIRACQDAGILVKMFTGDDATTASLTAAWVGLDGTALLTGAGLRTRPADTLPDAVARAAVFARVSAEEKQILVRALQSRHHLVALTGENDDDLPALGQADTAVDVRPTCLDGAAVDGAVDGSRRPGADRLGGPDPAGEHAGPECDRSAWSSADLVLRGGDFASITALIADGRSVLDDLARYLERTLPAALGPGLVLGIAALTGTTAPIQPLGLLWLSLVAALMLGALPAADLPAAVPPAVDLMRRPPLIRRPPGRLSPGRTAFDARWAARALLVTAILLTATFGLFHWELAHGGGLAAARTMVVDVLVFTLLAHLLSRRRARGTRFPPGRNGSGRGLLAAAGAVSLILLQVAYSQLPMLNDLFGSAPLDGAAWLRLLAAAIAGFAVIEATKRLPAPPISAA